MKSGSDGQKPCFHSEGLGHNDGSLDGFFFSRQHKTPRSVDVGEEHLVTHQTQNCVTLIVRTHNTGHAQIGTTAFHYELSGLDPLDNHLVGGLDVPDSGYSKRRDLSKAVPHHHIRINTLGLQDLRHAKLNGEQRCLSADQGTQIFLELFVVFISIDVPEQIKPELAHCEIVHLVDNISEVGVVLVEMPTHCDVVNPLPGETEYKILLFALPGNICGKETLGLERFQSVPAIDHLERRFEFGSKRLLIFE